ncbi:MAG: hypothetical protein ACM3ZE_19135 [Myxococcales bacterium]
MRSRDQPEVRLLVDVPSHAADVSHVRGRDQPEVRLLVDVPQEHAREGTLDVTPRRESASSLGIA